MTEEVDMPILQWHYDCWLENDTYVREETFQYESCLWVVPVLGGPLAYQNVTFFVSHNFFNPISQIRVVSHDE
jgi:hypothetical protein